MEPKGDIVLDKYPGEWEVMPSYIEEPRGGGLQVGLYPARRTAPGSTSPRPSSPSSSTPHPETGFPLAIGEGATTP